MEQIHCLAGPNSITRYPHQSAHLVSSVTLGKWASRDSRDTDLRGLTTQDMVAALRRDSNIIFLAEHPSEHVPSDPVIVVAGPEPSGLGHARALEVEAVDALYQAI